VFLSFFSVVIFKIPFFVNAIFLSYKGRRAGEPNMALAIFGVGFWL